MQRRKTRIGRGAFGHRVPIDQHATEVLMRILNKRRPLTEDALFLMLHNILRRRHGSQIFQKVRESKDVGGYKYFSFSPDIDLLEVRPSGEVVGYELKGYRKSGKSMKAPAQYEGIDQALAILKNPVAFPGFSVFAGSVFDCSYVVHPEGSDVEGLADLLEMCTPIGLVLVNHTGVRELVKPKPNPFLDQAMKAYFVSRLDTLGAYTQFKVNPVQ